MILKKRGKKKRFECSAIACSGKHGGQANSTEK